MHSKEPMRDRPQTEFIDLYDHPECRPTYKINRTTEVEAIMKTELKGDEHQHPLLH